MVNYVSLAPSVCSCGTHAVVLHGPASLFLRKIHRPLLSYYAAVCRIPGPLSGLQLECALAYQGQLEALI